MSLAAEHPGARATLDAFIGDLDRYRDTLSEDDLADLRSTPSLETARQQLRRALVATWLVFGFAIGVVALFLGIAVRWQWANLFR